ncbi:MAG: hypothetical protein V2A73_10485, partial [Pseudomonadota bacterium]
ESLTPISISLLPPLSFGRGKANLVALNIVAGHSSRLEGVEVRGLVGINDRSVRGWQIAGGANIVGGPVFGGQIAGGVNHARGAVAGVQIAGGVDYAGAGVVGAQVAGGAAVAGDDVYGVQVAGAATVARAGLVGAQIAGAVASAGKDVRGIQVAGASSITAGHLEGVQIAGGMNIAGGVSGLQIGVVNIGGVVEGGQIGVVNIASSVRGVQIGVVNLAKDVQGLPVGVLSFVRDGRIALEAWGGDSTFGNLTLKLGTRWVHSLFNLGLASLEMDRDERWTLGAGFGAHFDHPGRSYLDIDASVDSVRSGLRLEESNELLCRLRMTAGLELTSRLAVFVGVGVGVFVSDRLGSCGICGPSLAPSRTYQGNGAVVRIWPGLVAGIRI